MECRSILDVIQTLNNPLPKTIDVASIDIEGSEGEVLKCFPFDRLPVKNWLVETNQQPQVAVDWFFHRHGYDAVTTFGDSSNGGWFLDTLYSKKTRKEVLPAAGGKILHVVGQGRTTTKSIREVDGHEWHSWPSEKRAVKNSEFGPGKGTDWLACEE